jgi:membrane fusion protein, multidrug efflux system
MRIPRRYIVSIAVAVALAGAGYFYLLPQTGGPGGGGERGGGAPVFVTVAPVAERVFVDAIEAVGTAKANESIELTAKATETVGVLHFTDGQKVEKDYVVARMTSSEQGGDLATARAAAADAQRTYTRIKELSAKGFASRAQVDAATFARDSAAGRVTALESRMTDRTIKAPFAGVLGLRRVSVGTLVRPGDVITTLDDISIIKLDFTVAEAYLAALKTGMNVRVTVAAYGDRVFEGKVAGVDTRVDPVSRSLAVRAEIPNADAALHPGMLMTVALITAERTALAVREESIVPLESRHYVYVADAQMKAERREVKIGARDPGFVEIKGGLKKGERVVVDGTIRLRPGATVTLDPPTDEGKDKRRGGGARGPAT